MACEFSGTVRDAFLDLGHDAWSCDLKVSESIGPHYRGDVTKILDGWIPVSYTADCDPDGDGWCYVRDCDPSECKCIGPTQDGIEYKEIDGELFGRPIDSPNWDLMIAHPPCTYLAVSGIHWNSKLKSRNNKTLAALDFVRKLMDAPINRICIENPVSVISSAIRKPDQIIQPWHFGHDASKKTCLWLKNLPPLKETDRLPGNNATRRKNQTKSGQNKLGPSVFRQAERSKFYTGIAKAMAEQWGKFICTNGN